MYPVSTIYELRLGKVKSVFKHRPENNDVEDWSGRLSGDNTLLEMRIVKIIE